MDRFFAFVGGTSGIWSVASAATLIGEGLPSVERVDILAAVDNSGLANPSDALWTLRGVVSHERYVTHQERAELRLRSPALNRPEATCAALIPLRKNAEWWAMAQDERRTILEEQSGHIRAGMEALPAVARKLHHCRDLGEPFDFLTWFEFHPRDVSSFETLLEHLRRSEEWKYVDREIDIRLTHA